jgi:hypothetical protein
MSAYYSKKETKTAGRHLSVFPRVDIKKISIEHGLFVHTVYAKIAIHRNLAKLKY